MRRFLVFLALIAPTVTSAQPSAGAPAQTPDPADQLVGLFGATCLHFNGDPAAIRGFLTQQGAPAMPAQARDAFLAGRPGQVFDTSVPGINLALVSLDNGGCEAVVEKASAAAVKAALEASAREVNVPLTPLGSQAETLPNGVGHSAYLLVNGGRQLHVLLATAPTPPEAVLVLAPK